MGRRLGGFVYLGSCEKSHLIRPSKMWTSWQGVRSLLLPFAVGPSMDRGSWIVGTDTSGAGQVIL